MSKQATCRLAELQGAGHLLRGPARGRSRSTSGATPSITSDIDEDTVDLAREAVKACPTLALRMVDARR